METEGLLDYPKSVRECSWSVRDALTDTPKDRRNSLKMKFLGRTFLGHQRPRYQDISDPGPRMSQTKTFFAMRLFSVVPDGMAGMSRDLGRDVPGFGLAQLAHLSRLPKGCFFPRVLLALFSS